MRNLILIIALGLIIACQAPATNTDEAAQTPVAAQAAPAPSGLQPPYEIEDSSKIQLVDGIQIYVAEKGTGHYAKPENNVVINYRGTLLDGSVFDESFSKPGVADFPLGRLIQGWQIALTKVPTGSKVRLIVPSELGYGAQGSPPNIPPNATLIFDIHLISAY